MTNLIEELFTLTYDDEPDRVIRGRVVRSPTVEVAPFVVVAHGFKGFMDWGFFPVLARRLAEAGFAAVAFNASGSGIGPDLMNFTEERAFARDTLTRQLEDFERVRAHVAGGAFRGVDARCAGLLGHSRGGGAALIHAAEQGGYGALVTWAAIDTVHRWDESTLAQWRELGHLPVVNARTGQTLRMDLAALEDLESNAQRFDIEAACARIGCPTLACHGDVDEAVAFEALGRIGRALPAGLGRTLSVAGAGHTFGARHPMTETSAELEEVLGASVAWFRTYLRGDPDGLV